MLKTGIAVGIFCVLMLISFPWVIGDFIVYPKEEGPYTILIGGKTYAGSISS